MRTVIDNLKTISLLKNNWLLKIYKAIWSNIPKLLRHFCDIPLRRYHLAVTDCRFEEVQALASKNYI